MSLKNELKMNKTLKRVLKYLIEIIIVAFGVFLGVYYSNISADNKKQKEKNRSIDLIIGELEFNKQLLEEQIEYHEKIKVEMDSIIPSLSEKEMYANFTRTVLKNMEIKNWKGFHFARLQKTAYESTKTSGIVKEFDIELVQKLSDIYDFQNGYMDFGTLILNKAIGINSSMKMMDFISTIELMTSDLLGTENYLLIKLEKSITELKTPHNNGYN